jgi:type IV pilus modification protein PilV
MCGARSRDVVAAPGFTLVEVLVVMVVMAVGLLGSVALLLTGLRASRLAIQQAGAANLAADLGDRIRANRYAGAAYALDAGTLLAPPARSCRSTGECDIRDVAAHDLYEWQQAAMSSLPDATTSVRVAPGSDPAENLYFILVEWARPGRRATARFALTVQA